MAIGIHAAIDWSVLQVVVRAVVLIVIPGAVVEFLSSFEFCLRPADHPKEDDHPEDPWVEVSFRLGGEWFDMSLRRGTGRGASVCNGSR
ncbi:hypothetical protein Hanom_Chr16g01520251 [Helianthus anomalus]